MAVPNAKTHEWILYVVAASSALLASEEYLTLAGMGPPVAGHCHANLEIPDGECDSRRCCVRARPRGLATARASLTIPAATLVNACYSTCRYRCLARSGPTGWF